MRSRSAAPMLPSSGMSQSNRRRVSRQCRSTSWLKSGAAVGVGVLSCSEQPTAALRFARFLTARDRGLPHLSRAGFSVVSGDAWAETPQLHLRVTPTGGARIRRIVDDFERREGVRVLRDYDLPGIEGITLTDDPDTRELATRLHRALVRPLEDGQR